MIAVRPSSAAVWAGAGCTQYPHMVSLYSEREMDNTAAEEGTAAHWLAEQLLNGGALADYLGGPSSNHVTITEDMADAVREYTDHAKGLRGALQVERPVAVFNGCKGTPDLWTYDSAEDTLHVIDYKHGFGVVEPMENWQLSLYAAGIIKHWEGDKKPQKVRLTVVQPRAYTPDGVVRSWDTGAATVEAMRIQAATRAAEVHTSPTARSGSHCKHCPGRHACPAAVSAGVQLYEAVTNSKPYDLEDNELGVQYAILQRAHEQMGFLVSAYEQQIKRALYRGGKVDGYGLAEKHGRAEWTVDAEEVRALGDLFGVDLCPPTPLTPSKAIKKGVDTDVISAYTTKHSKGHTLITVNLTKAKRIFS